MLIVVMDINYFCSLVLLTCLVLYGVEGDRAISQQFIPWLIHLRWLAIFRSGFTKGLSLNRRTDTYTIAAKKSLN